MDTYFIGIYFFVMAHIIDFDQLTPEQLVRYENLSKAIIHLPRETIEAALMELFYITMRIESLGVSELLDILK